VVPPTVKAEEPGRTVWLPTTRRIAPEVVSSEGTAAAGEREVVAPFTTTTPLEARDMVVPEIVTAGAPGLMV
jgi:hypothetical protein